MFRQTWVEIDLEALEHNFNVAKKLAQADTAILVPVKADAYGHGIEHVSAKLQDLGVDYLGVGAMDEAVYLRQTGINVPILFLGSALPQEVPAACENNVSLTVSSKEQLNIFNRIAQEKNKRLPVHIKIDTGMSRLGIWHEQVLSIFENIYGLKNIEIEGIYTHFHSAESEDKSLTNAQIENFNAAIDKITKRAGKFKYIHASNSMGLLNFKRARFNLVRPGLMIYGLYPDASRTSKYIPEIKPILEFKSKLVFIKKVRKGESISYGRTYTADEDKIVGIVPVGYGDGYLRGLSNKASVLIHGQRAKVLGRVCMDQIIIDLSNIQNPKIADEVVLIGRQDKEQIRTEELAKICGTISYEIVCLISKRVPRIIKDNQITDFRLQITDYRKK